MLPEFSSTDDELTGIALHELPTPFLAPIAESQSLQIKNKKRRQEENLGDAFPEISAKN